MPTPGHLLSQFHSDQETTLLFKNENLWLGIVVNIFNRIICEGLRQVGLCDIETGLVYVLGFRVARTM